MPTEGGSGRAVSGNLAVLGVVLAAVLAAAVGAVAMTGSGEPSADAVLNDARERYASAETVAGSAVVTFGNGTVNRSAEVTFAVAEDNRSRVAITAANRTVVVGSNGSVGWIHFREEGLTRVVPLPKDDDWGNGTAFAHEGVNETESLRALVAVVADRYGDRLPANESWNGSYGRNGSDDWNESDVEHDWNGSDRNGSKANGLSHGWNGSDPGSLVWAWTRESATAERVGIAAVDGTEAHLIEIEPAGDREGVFRVWIATGDARVLKSEFAHGDWTVTVQYTDVRFDVSLADSTFRPPGDGLPGTTTVDSRDELQAATAFDVPAVPEAYRFADGSTAAYGNATVAVGTYAGPGNVTVVTTDAEQLPIDEATGSGEANATTIDLSGVTASVAETDGGAVVSWEVDGLRYAVVSEESREAAVSVAESIVDGSDADE
jgi:outer membrane lipoprotein-sorting protein